MKKTCGLLVCLLSAVFISGCAETPFPQGRQDNIGGLLKYREMTYGEYLAGFCQEAEFYHGVRFTAPTDIPGVEIVFEGIYDEETAGAKLENDSRSIRLQGRLGSILSELPDEVSEDDIINALSKNYGDTLQYSYEEGVETAYYVGASFFQILLDTDRDSSLDTSLQIPLYDGENISEETIVWLNWES